VSSIPGSGMYWPDKQRTPPWRPLTNARVRARQSAADIQPLDQVLVACLVALFDVVEQLTTLRHELQQPAARVVVFRVRLEVLCQVVDAFRQDRNLDLGRTGVAGLERKRLDDFSLAAGGDRHRQ